MSEEWSINWDVVDQKLQAILEELKAEGKTEIDQDTEAVVRERLVAAVAPPAEVALFPMYVHVNIYAGTVKMKTVFTGTKHFEGTINSKQGFVLVRRLELAHHALLQRRTGVGPVVVGSLSAKTEKLTSQHSIWTEREGLATSR